MSRLSSMCDALGVDQRARAETDQVLEQRVALDAGVRAEAQALLDEPDDRVRDHRRRRSRGAARRAACPRAAPARAICASRSRRLAPLGSPGGEHARVGERRREHAGMGVGVLDDRLERAQQSLASKSAAPATRARTPSISSCGSLVGEREEGRALVGEVQVEGPDRDVRRARDVLRSGRVVAALSEERARRSQQPSPSLRLLAVPPRPGLELSNHRR